MITQAPRIKITDIFAAFFIFLGLILFLTVLHLLTIEVTGNVKSVMNTIFIIFLNVFITLAILAGAFVIIHFLKYLVWMATTPKWLRKKMTNNKRE